MNNRKTMAIWFIAFFCATMACIVSLVAQSTNGVPEAGAATIGAFGTAQFWLDVLTPIIGPLLTAGVKKAMPYLPLAAIPVIAIVLGTLVNALGTVSLGNDPAIWKAVLLGAAGIGVRELQHNFRTSPDSDK